MQRPRDKADLNTVVVVVVVSIGFDLGCTIQSKTKGIWAWVRPHPVKPDWCVVLLDTEGLGDVEKVHVCFKTRTSIHHGDTNLLENSCISIDSVQTLLRNFGVRLLTFKVDY